MKPDDNSSHRLVIRRDANGVWRMVARPAPPEARGTPPPRPHAAGERREAA